LDGGGVGGGWEMLDGLPVVECPGCKVKMTVILVAPMTLPNDRMDEVTYQCPQCDTETKRQYARPSSPEKLS
jgi:RNase P subunit RPR2